MGNQLNPGFLKPTIPNNPPGNATDYSLFVGSMAEQMETQLNALMIGDGLPPLPTDPADQTVRDRRRLFVAIARGVVFHLAANEGAFVIGTNNTTIAELTDINTV